MAGMSRMATGWGAGRPGPTGLGVAPGTPEEEATGLGPAPGTYGTGLAGTALGTSPPRRGKTMASRSPAGMARGWMVKATPFGLLAPYLVTTWPMTAGLSGTA